jgi:hypothetical protein
VPPQGIAVLETLELEDAQRNSEDKGSDIPPSLSVFCVERGAGRFCPDQGELWRLASEPPFDESVSDADAGSAQASVSRPCK